MLTAHFRKLLNEMKAISGKIALITLNRLPDEKRAELLTKLYFRNHNDLCTSELFKRIIKIHEIHSSEPL
jgi:hypothetical protein